VRRHSVAGLIVKDLFRGFEFWLVDEGLESSLPDEDRLVPSREGWGAYVFLEAKGGRESLVRISFRFHQGRG
jgi:hypothetical protein